MTEFSAWEVTADENNKLELCQFFGKKLKIEARDDLRSDLKQLSQLQVNLSRTPVNQSAKPFSFQTAPRRPSQVQQPVAFRDLSNHFKAKEVPKSTYERPSKVK